MGGLGPQQISQDLHGRAVALQARGDRLVEGAGHALQAQLGEGFDHLMPLHGNLAADRNGRSRRSGGWRRARASDVVIGAGAGGSRRLARMLRITSSLADAGVQGFADRVVDRVQAVDQHRRQHAHEAPVGLVAAAQLAPQPGQGRRQRPVQERRAVAQRAGLAGQDRQVVPGIIDRPAPAEAAGVLGHHLAGAAHDDPVGIGADLHRHAAPPWPSPSSGCGRR